MYTCNGHTVINPSNTKSTKARATQKSKEWITPIQPVDIFDSFGVKQQVSDRHIGIHRGWVYIFTYS